MVIYILMDGFYCKRNINHYFVYSCIYKGVLRYE